MFGSFHSSINRLHESRVHIDPRSGASTFKLPSIIKIDFAGTTPGQRKRSSFLPADFDDDLGLGRTSSQYNYISGSADQKIYPTPLPKNFEKKTFITGSRYIGQFNQLGMAGKGIYKYPHGVIYDGYFNKKGEFHGTGVLIYPGGQRVEGIWKNGTLIDSGANCVASDNSKFDSNYCKIPDRRFQIELNNDVQPAGQEYLTNSEVARVIPPGMYDTGYGFYDPKRKVVIDYQDPKQYKNLFEMMDDERKLLYQILEAGTRNEASLTDIASQSKPDTMIMHINAIPPDEKEKWVISNCRKAWDENVGYRPDLYEVWNAGYGREDYQIARELSKLSHSKADAIIRKFSKPESKISDLYSFMTAKIETNQKLQMNNTVIDLIFSKQYHQGKKRAQRRKRLKSIVKANHGTVTPVSFTSDIASIMYDIAPGLEVIEKLQ